MKSTQEKKQKGKWDPAFYVLSYQLAKDGLSDKEIAQTIGVSSLTFGNWKQKRPALESALEQARDTTQKGSIQTFEDYVYNRLPENLKDYWNEIQKCSKGRTSTARMEGMFSDAGKRVRQQLFIHAYISSNFNPSEALRKLNLTRRTLNKWVAEEPEFSDLMDEIMWHKKNFFESSLVKLIKKGNALATIFANKTVNRDRGYGDKIDLNVQGEITHNINYISVDKLDLPLSVRKQILVAIRKQKTLRQERDED